VCALIAFLHCDLVRKTFVAKLGVRLQIRAKSLYQLFEVIQFLKLLNRIVRGQFSLGQTLQVIALGQKHTSPGGAYDICNETKPLQRSGYEAEGRGCKEVPVWCGGGGFGRMNRRSNAACDMQEEEAAAAAGEAEEEAGGGWS
jgi:hypothetical protein